MQPTRRLVCATFAALSVLFSVTLTAQDVPKARQLLEQALEALKPAPVVAAIQTPEAFDQALAAAVPGAVLTLAPTFVYSAPLTIRQSVTLQGTPPAGRMTRGPPLPSFRAGLTIAGDGVTLIGVEVRHTNPLTDILIVQGAHVTLDRVRVLGDPVTGAKRCISANSNGDLKVLQSFADDCFASSPGADSQAIAAWDMGPGLRVEDSYLSGGSETVLLGGADAPEARTPTDITFRRNTITKNPAWMGQPVGVKNLIEIKNAKQVLFEDNDCSYAWVNGQTGFLLVLSVRNQDGRAPWATIQDVTFRRNTWRDGGGAINILGRDDIKETGAGRDVPVGTIRRSVPMARVTIQNETYSVDPVKYAKTSNMKLLQIGGGPIDLTIDTVSFSSLSAVGSAIYWTGGPKASNLTLTNLRIPKSSFGMFSVAGGSKNYTATNLAWTTYVQSGTIANITETP